MTPRSNVVRLRLTDMEKADWQKAAGGARLLSDFIRRVVNEACAKEREGVPVEQAAAKALLPGAVIPVEAGETREKAVVKAANAQCPRWMHHRPGTYCGSCKKVIGK